MATPQEKAQRVLLNLQTQRNFRTNSKYGGDPPSGPSIRAWHKMTIYGDRDSVR